MGQALYRKYRSKTLDEVFGQEHITKTLSNAIKTGRISHAYLFTGPHGVGKTSVARILAHQLNGVSYVGEDSHLDIIEIDAASTGGVDEVRELREKIYVAPTTGKYKVYIIDEVHMMSTPAFNALLKTLEEPPAHVIFILATTEAHKLPATIISRTQRYTFRPIPADTEVKHLSNLAKLEKISITDEALRLIAEHSNGSFRDGIGMLDQASSLHKKISRNELENLLGIPSAEAIRGIISFLQEHNSSALVSLLLSLRADGYQAASIAKQLAQSLRTSMLTDQKVLGRTEILNILNRLIDVPASDNPDQLLEIILLEAALKSDSQNSPSIDPSSENVRHETSETKDGKAFVTKNSASSVNPQPPAVAKPIDNINIEIADLPNLQTKSDSSDLSITIDDEQWQAVLEELKRQYNTLYGIVKLGRSEFLPGKVVLTFGYAFHQKRANDVKNKDIMSTVLLELTGQIITVECFYEKDDTSTLVTSDNFYDTTEGVVPLVSNYDTISNIFGGGELLES